MPNLYIKHQSVIIWNKYFLLTDPYLHNYTQKSVRLQQVTFRNSKFINFVSNFPRNLSIQ